MPDQTARDIAVLRRKMQAVMDAYEQAGPGGALAAREKLAKTAIERLPQLLDKLEAFRRATATLDRDLKMMARTVEKA